MGGPLNLKMGNEVVLRDGFGMEGETGPSRRQTRT
jgi:hypothetical protein